MLFGDKSFFRKPLSRLALSLLLTGGTMQMLSGCRGATAGLNQKAQVPVPNSLIFKMKAKGMKPSAPIMMRIFKQENKLEVWKQKSNGRYALLTDFEICKWSGKFGPKFKEGDRQAPEGFYHVNRHRMNPNSQYHLSFNMGYPNAYDRSHGRTGAHLMVHGACSSAGCYSMTDEYVEVIYALARDAFKGGQKSFQIQAYPFRLTAENMVKHRNSKHYKFWNMLRKGNDLFEITKLPPKVDVCERRYEFATQSRLRYPSSGKCPPRSMKRSLATAYLNHENAYARKYEKLLARAEGRAAKEIVPLTYATALPGIKVEGAPVAKSDVAKPVTASLPQAVKPVTVPGDASGSPVALKRGPVIPAAITQQATQPQVPAPKPGAGKLENSLKPSP